MKTVFLLKSFLSWLFGLTFAYPVFLLVLLHLTTINSHAAQVTLEWDAVNHPLLGGYMVYYGTYSGDYDDSVDVGNWTSVTFAELEEDETYYFAVTAYSVYEEESEYSNEVCLNCATGGGGGGGGCFIATAANGS